MLQLNSLKSIGVGIGVGVEGKQSFYAESGDENNGLARRQAKKCVSTQSASSDKARSRAMSG
jgi:hypothetical protein